jgi:hypothetical protein
MNAQISKTKSESRVRDLVRGRARDRPQRCRLARGKLLTDTNHFVVLQAYH